MRDWRAASLNAGLLWMRVLVGLSIAKIGYGKVFGGQVQQLQEGLVAMGFPAPALFAWLAALSEFLGGLFIAVGFGTRISALLLLVTMCVAFFKAHAADPFHVKIPAFMYGVVAGGLALTGAGRYAVDAFLCRRFCKTAEPGEAA